jgi:RNA polymerase sigma-70 factor (ECF subfamily)
MRTQENVGAGMSADQARAAALAKFGHFESIRRTCRRTLLGERIMLQRLQMTMTALLFLVVAAFGYTTYMFQRANQEALTSVAEQLVQLNNANANNLQQANAQFEARLESVQRSQSAHPAQWEADRPRVVDTFPVHEAFDVDVATSEIRVTFDKDMCDGCWSWVRSSSEAFPESVGEVRYLEDMKTCVMPVKLEPGTKYVVWFNTGSYQNFKDRDGRPAVPHLLAFTTRE